MAKEKKSIAEGNLPIYIVTLIILVLGFGTYYIYGKLENKVNHVVTEAPVEKKINEELTDVLSYSIKNENDSKKLIGIKEDGEEINILDLSEYSKVVFDCYDNKIYLYLQNKNSEISLIGYVSLTNKIYELKKLIDVNNIGSPVSIAIVNNYIYYSSDDGSNIKKYDLINKKDASTKVTDDDNIVKVYSISNTYLAYGDGYEINLHKGANEGNTILTTNGKICFTIENKIIYLEYLNESKTIYQYYEYDVDTSKENTISDLVENDVANSETNKIVPYYNGYLFVSDKTVYLNRNNEITSVYTFADNINNINLISNSNLRVRKTNNEIYSNSIVNIQTKFANETGDDINYEEVLYLK